MDKNRFSQFEERIEALVEGGFARLFAGRLKPREVALRLARAMEDGAEPDEAGTPRAPNHYVVHLHPDDHAALLASEPRLATILAEHLVALARESGLWLDSPPDVVLVPDGAVTLHAVMAYADHVTAARQTTQMLLALEAEPAHPGGEAPGPPPAFLVLGGDRYVPLDRTVINVGRRRDNTIVLDDRRVSRHHCQLRLRFGQFVLYDLGSRGGTFVNNVRVSECTLRSGDVISLAGVPVVYVVEEPGAAGPRPAGGGDTQISVNPDRHGGGRDDAR